MCFGFNHLTPQSLGTAFLVSLGFVEGLGSGAGFGSQALALQCVVLLTVGLLCSVYKGERDGLPVRDGMHCSLKEKVKPVDSIAFSPPFFVTPGICSSEPTPTGD